MELKAIETSYKGCKFRSRLEARWAVLFDNIGIEWLHESEGFQMGKTRYLPDFWLPGPSYFIEVKGKGISVKEHGKIEALREASPFPVIVVGEIPEPGIDCEYDGFEWQTLRVRDDDARLVAPKGRVPQSFAEGCFPSLVCPVCLTATIGVYSINHRDWVTPGQESIGGGALLHSDIEIFCRCANLHSWTVNFANHESSVSFGIHEIREETGDLLVDLCHGDRKKRDAACKAARSARFEHGETPK